MVYIFLAEGFEEVEAITPIDYLRRSGLDVCCVGVGGLQIKGSHNIVVEADVELENCDFNLKNSLIILPGGIKGTKNLSSNEKVLKILKEVNECGSLAAICAAPTILGKLNLLVDKKACCYPGCEQLLTGADVVFNKDVVVYDNVITSKGAGTAQQFAFEIVKYLKGEEFATKLMSEVQWNI